jgi:acyl-CoA reductase-like NAD-dependent aldehyde dehydrogenase
MVDFNSGYQLTIDGRAAPTTRTFDAYNPATRSVIAAVPDATREQLDLAVASARRAFGSWSTSSFETRQSAFRDRRGARETRRGLHGALDQGTRQAARRC